MSAISLNSLGMLISNRQQNSAIAFVAWILIGLVVGFIGSQILNQKERHLARYVLLSIVGAIRRRFLI